MDFLIVQCDRGIVPIANSLRSIAKLWMCGLIKVFILHNFLMRGHFCLKIKRKSTPYDLDASDGFGSDGFGSHVHTYSISHLRPFCNLHFLQAANVELFFLQKMHDNTILCIIFVLNFNHFLRQTLPQSSALSSQCSKQAP